MGLLIYYQPMEGEQNPLPLSHDLVVRAGHLLFDSVKAFRSAFGFHANPGMADVPNDRDIQPILQISEVMG